MITVGNHAGWALRFEPAAGDAVTITSATHDGTIAATLPSGLEPGSYRFVVAGLTAEDHRVLATATVIRLYLFWRDTNASVAGYLAGVTGVADVLAAFQEPPADALVAVLAPKHIAWAARGTRFETVIEACERVHHVLREPIRAAPESKTELAAAVKIAHAFKLTVTSHETQSQTSTRPNLVAPPAGTEALRALEQLAERSADATGHHGRGLYLVRDGELHVGPRPIPLKPGEPETLDAARGLIRAADKGSTGERRCFELTLKGRPDLKPGDVVRFPLPAAAAVPTVPGPRLGEAAALLAEVRTIRDVLAGPATPQAGSTADLYVSSVSHRLDRAQGFITTLAGVTLQPGDSGWDPVTGARDPKADGAAAARSTVEALAVEALSRSAPADVAEVRSATTSGTAEPPSQSTSVWRGTAAPDGLPHGGRRLDIRRQKPDAVTGVAYTTPFAWGRCGLVLPRYPGTRVTLLHRGGRRDDPLDVGAVWASGAGPDSQPGDWWLILPVGVPQADRASVPDGQTPSAHTGKVTNDLIDADGNRVIEVGELTIRVGRDAKLGDAGERPARGEQDAVTIEHAEKGSRIVMKPDGTIVIEAKAALELKAGTDILMSANNVKVKVKDAMEVS